MKTLPDYLQSNLNFISIGLNPNPLSVEAGYYFANPRNRFWRALNGSRLVDEKMTASEAAMADLFSKYRIGFTDLVKRPSTMGKDLRAADYKEYGPELKEKLLEYQPLIAWFHGQGTYNSYMKYVEGVTARAQLGLQKQKIGRTHVFVTPNPSPANAKFSLDDLIRCYDEMVSFRIREAFGMG